MLTSISVAIINFNTREHLRTCLDSVSAESPEEVVVVDNGSTDGSCEMVRDRYPHVTLEVNRHNRGYGAACNQAVARCTAPYVFLLNSDTVLERGALVALRDYLDGHPLAAMAGPRLVEPGGTLQASCFYFPSPLHVFLAEAHFKQIARYLPGIRNRYLRTWKHDSARKAPWVLGAALAIRRSAFEAVGGFDSGYLMYFEEVDLCYRCWQAGYEVHFAPVTTLIHVGGASTAQRRSDMTVHFYASLKRFYSQHYSRLRRIQLNAIVKCSTLAALIRDSIRLQLHRHDEKRDQIAGDIEAWKRIVLGQWPEQLGD